MREERVKTANTKLKKANKKVQFKLKFEKKNKAKFENEF